MDLTTVENERSFWFAFETTNSTNQNTALFYELAVSMFFLKLIPTFFFRLLNKVQSSTILHWATRVKVLCLCGNVTTYNKKLWAMIALNRVLKKSGFYPTLGEYT